MNEFYIYTGCVVGLAIAFFFDARLLAYYVTKLVKILAGKRISVFQIGAISLFHHAIEDFEVRIPVTTTSPQATITFKRIEVVVHYGRFFATLATLLSRLSTRKSVATGDLLPLLSIIVKDLSVGSDHIWLRDFMMPGEKSKARPPYRISRRLITAFSIAQNILRNTMRWIEIEMRDFSFDFVMPGEEVAMQGSAENILVRFQPSKAILTESLTVHVVLRDGILEINEHNERAMLYAGHITRFLVDYHLPTGMMDVLVNLYGTEHDMEVNIPRFMAFFTKFNEADDFTAGLKIARGMEPNGKMSMCCEIDHLKVGVTDTRIAAGQQQLIMRIEKMRASLSTFKLTVDKRRTHKGRLCIPELNTPSNRTLGSDSFLPPLLDDKSFLSSITGQTMPSTSNSNADFVLSRNNEKEMTAICSKVVFQLSSLSHQFYVSDASFVKVLHVRNEGDCIDTDETAISLQTLHMFGLDQRVIDWLLVLQDTSNRLPMSIHSHRRRSKMQIQAETMGVSLCPVSFTVDIAQLREAHNGDVLPVVPLDDERLIVIHMHQLNVSKTLAPTLPLVSEYTVFLARQEIHTCMPLTDFERQHQILLLEQGRKSHHSSDSSGGKKATGATFGELVNQATYLPRAPRRLNANLPNKGHRIAESFCAHDGTHWKALGTGSVWKLYGLTVQLSMGAKTVFRSAQLTQMTIDLVNSHLVPVINNETGSGPLSARNSTERPFVAEVTSTRASKRNQIDESHPWSGAPSSSTSARNTQASTSSSANHNSSISNRKASSDSGNQNRSTKRQMKMVMSQHEFLSLVHMTVRFTHEGLEANVNMRTLNLQMSVAGLLKARCAYTMIKASMDAMLLRMECTRLLGDFHLLGGTNGVPGRQRMKTPDPPDASSYEVRVEDLTALVAVSMENIGGDTNSCSSSPMHYAGNNYNKPTGINDDGSVSVGDTPSFTSNNTPYTNTTNNTTKNLNAADNSGKCLIIKMANFVMGNQGPQQKTRTHVDHCEMSLSHHPSKPFVSLTQVDYIVQKTTSQEGDDENTTQESSNSSPNSDSEVAIEDDDDDSDSEYAAVAPASSTKRRQSMMSPPSSTTQRKKPASQKKLPKLVAIRPKKKIVLTTTTVRLQTCHVQMHSEMVVGRFVESMQTQLALLQVAMQPRVSQKNPYRIYHDEDDAATAAEAEVSKEVADELEQLYLQSSNNLHSSNSYPFSSAANRIPSAGSTNDLAGSDVLIHSSNNSSNHSSSADLLRLNPAVQRDLLLRRSLVGQQRGHSPLTLGNAENPADHSLAEQVIRRASSRDASQSPPVPKTNASTDLPDVIVEDVPNEEDAEDVEPQVDYLDYPYYEDDNLESYMVDSRRTSASSTNAAAASASTASLAANTDGSAKKRSKKREEDERLTSPEIHEDTSIAVEDIENHSVLTAHLDEFVVKIEVPLHPLPENSPHFRLNNPPIVSPMPFGASGGKRPAAMPIIANQECILSISWRHLHMVLEQLQDADSVQDDLLRLDLGVAALSDDLSFLQRVVSQQGGLTIYQQISGGQLHMGAQHMIMSLSLQQEPLLFLVQPRITGLLYSASVKDTSATGSSIPVAYEIVQCLDTQRIVLLPFDQRLKLQNRQDKKKRQREAAEKEKEREKARQRQCKQREREREREEPPLTPPPTQQRQPRPQSRMQRMFAHRGSGVFRIYKHDPTDPEDSGSSSSNLDRLNRQNDDDKDKDEEEILQRDEAADEEWMATAPLLAVPEPAVPLYAVISKSVAPSKLYGNVDITCASCDVYVHADTVPVLSLCLGPAIEVCVPPNRDPLTPPLAGWDSLRYWCHGTLSMQMYHQITMTYHLPNVLSEAMTLRWAVQQPQMHFDDQAFEFAAGTCDVWVYLVSSMLRGGGGANGVPKHYSSYHAAAVVSKMTAETSGSTPVAGASMITQRKSRPTQQQQQQQQQPASSNNSPRSPQRRHNSGKQSSSKGSNNGVKKLRLVHIPDIVLALRYRRLPPPSNPNTNSSNGAGNPGSGAAALLSPHTPRRVHTTSAATSTPLSHHVPATPLPTTSNSHPQQQQQHMLHMMSYYSHHHVYTRPCIVKRVAIHSDGGNTISSNTNVSAINGAVNGASMRRTTSSHINCVRYLLDNVYYADLVYRYGDRFTYFRLPAQCMAWDLELRLAQREHHNDIVAFNLRLDILLRIHGALLHGQGNPSSGSSVNNQSHNNSHSNHSYSGYSSGNNSTANSNNNNNGDSGDHGGNKGISEVVKRTGVSSPLDLVAQFDVQWLMDETLLSSLLSDTLLKGVVFKHQVLDIQLRLKRKVLHNNNAVMLYNQNDNHTAGNNAAQSSQPQKGEPSSSTKARQSPRKRVSIQGIPNSRSEDITGPSRPNSSRPLIPDAIRTSSLSSDRAVVARSDEYSEKYDGNDDDKDDMPVVALPLAPLQVDHLFMELHMAELYVDAWDERIVAQQQSSHTSNAPNGSSTTSTNNNGPTSNNSSSADATSGSTGLGLFGRSRALTMQDVHSGNTAGNRNSFRFTSSSNSSNNAHNSNNSGNGTANKAPFSNLQALFTLREPQTPRDFTRLLRPLCKFAHASRIVVSLTESGEVSHRSLSFVTSGILQQQKNQQQHSLEDTFFQQQRRKQSVNKVTSTNTSSNSVNKGNPAGTTKQKKKVSIVEDDYDLLSDKQKDKHKHTSAKKTAALHALRASSDDDNDHNDIKDSSDAPYSDNVDEKASSKRPNKLSKTGSTQVSPLGRLASLALRLQVQEEEKKRRTGRLSAFVVGREWRRRTLMHTSMASSTATAATSGQASASATASAANPTTPNPVNPVGIMKNSNLLSPETPQGNQDVSGTVGGLASDLSPPPLSKAVRDKLRAWRHSSDHTPPPRVLPPRTTSSSTAIDVTNGSGKVTISGVNPLLMRHSTGTSVKASMQATSALKRPPSLMQPSALDSDAPNSSAPVHINSTHSTRMSRRQGQRSRSNSPLPPTGSDADGTAAEAAASLVKRWVPQNGYRAVLRAFASNHAAFTPPQMALPRSYEGRKSLRVLGGGVLGGALGGGSGGAQGGVTNLGSPTLKAHHHQLLQQQLQQQQLLQQQSSSTTAYTDPYANYASTVPPSLATPSSTSSFGDKIWGLRVIDGRILFTIDMRDVLFEYVARTMDVFFATHADDITSTNNNSNSHLQKHTNKQSKRQKNQSNKDLLDEDMIVNNPMHMQQQISSTTNTNHHHSSIKSHHYASNATAAAIGHASHGSGHPANKHETNRASLADFMLVDVHASDPPYTPLGHHRQSNHNTSANSMNNYAHNQIMAQGSHSSAGSIPLPPPAPTTPPMSPVTLLRHHQQQFLAPPHVQPQTLPLTLPQTQPQSHTPFQSELQLHSPSLQPIAEGIQTQVPSFLSSHSLMNDPNNNTNSIAGSYSRDRIYSMTSSGGENDTLQQEPREHSNSYVADDNFSYSHLSSSYNNNSTMDVNNIQYTANNTSVSGIFPSANNTSNASMMMVNSPPAASSASSVTSMAAAASVVHQLQQSRLLHKKARASRRGSLFNRSLEMADPYQHQHQHQNQIQPPLQHASSTPTTAMTNFRSNNLDANNQRAHSLSSSDPNPFAYVADADVPNNTSTSTSSRRSVLFAPHSSSSVTSRKSIFTDPSGNHNDPSIHTSPSASGKQEDMYSIHEDEAALHHTTVTFAEEGTQGSVSRGAEGPFHTTPTPSHASLLVTPFPPGGVSGGAPGTAVAGGSFAHVVHSRRASVASSAAALRRAARKSILMSSAAAAMSPLNAQNNAHNTSVQSVTATSAVDSSQMMRGSSWRPSPEQHSQLHLSDAEVDYDEQDPSFPKSASSQAPSSTHLPSPPPPPPPPPQPQSTFFFVVEFVDPQLNFLDTETHSSLIIVTTRALVEGQRLNTSLLLTDRAAEDEDYDEDEDDEDIEDNGEGAGEGLLDGERKACPSIFPRRLNIAAKRRQEIRLKMDGVSAYTVPSYVFLDNNPNSNNNINAIVEDEVHWKAMHSTAERVDRSYAQGNNNNSSGNNIGHNGSNSNSNNSSGVLGSSTSFYTPRTPQSSKIQGLNTSTHSNTHNNTYNNTLNNSSNANTNVKAAYQTAESPYMKVAIRDFQIRALYIFWTDTTQEEARDLYLARRHEFLEDSTAQLTTSELLLLGDEDDLTYTFRIELPELCVDITSFQFYILLHVVKHVLLVPPPARETYYYNSNFSEANANANGPGGNSAGNNGAGATRARAHTSGGHDGGGLDDREDDEGANSAQQIVNIPRDPSVLAKYNIRASQEPLNIHHQRSREEVRVLVEEFIRRNSGLVGGAGGGGEVGGATARFMEVFIGRMSWILRTTGLHSNNTNTSSSANAANATNNERKELIEAGFVGIYASITFHENRSLNSSFEIQRLWVTNHMPGEDTASFQDPTCVLRPELQEPTELCTRCNVAFDVEHNPATACVFHADDDGNPGVYSETMYYDELSCCLVPQRVWSCCGQHHPLAAGCSARPHMGKEVMVSIRVDAHPRARVGDDVDISIIQGIEISIFPGANYALRVQITRSLADTLHRYFSIDSGVDMNEVNLLHNSATTSGNVTNSSMMAVLSSSNNNSAEGQVGATTTTASATSGRSSSIFSALFKRGKKHKDKKNKQKNNGSNNANSNNSHASSDLNSTDAVQAEGDQHSVASSHASSGVYSNNTNSHAGAMNSGTTTGTHMLNASRMSSHNLLAHSNNNNYNNNNYSGSETRSVVAAQKKKARRQEALYLRRLRVGEIYVDVSTAGFALGLNLDRFSAEMEPFLCRGEVLDWRKLIWNFERHLVWSLTKHTASNSLSRISAFFGGGLLSSSAAHTTAHTTHPPGLTGQKMVIPNSNAQKSLLFGTKAPPLAPPLAPLHAASNVSVSTPLPTPSATPLATMSNANVASNPSASVHVSSPQNSNHSASVLSNLFGHASSHTPSLSTPSNTSSMFSAVNSATSPTPAANEEVRQQRLLVQQLQQQQAQNQQQVLLQQQLQAQGASSSASNTSSNATLLQQQQQLQQQYLLQLQHQHQQQQRLQREAQDAARKRSLLLGSANHNILNNASSNNNSNTTTRRGLFFGYSTPQPQPAPLQQPFPETLMSPGGNVGGLNISSLNMAGRVIEASSADSVNSDLTSSDHHSATSASASGTTSTARTASLFLGTRKKSKSKGRSQSVDTALQNLSSADNHPNSNNNADTTPRKKRFGFF